MAPSKTWFITGTSRGFGREWALAALERGDKVAATARDVSALDGLVESYGDNVLAMALDVTDRVAAFARVRQAHEHFGRLDVIVNNAGYGLFGMVEEVSEDEARDQIETNLFGALWVTQAVLPLLRGQGSGHILQVSSIGGISAFPMVGMYHASKWALEGLSQSLAQEVADFGVKVTLIEPGGFSTDWSGSSARRAAPLEAYDGVRDKAEARRASRGQPGDPPQQATQYCGSSTPTSRRCGSSSARRHWPSRRPTTSRGCGPGTSGSRYRSRRRGSTRSRPSIPGERFEFSLWLKTRRALHPVLQP